jgi:uncharacterized phage-like protein YoqJ
MYKIGIIGHSPEHFSNPTPDEIVSKIKDAIELLRYQYKDADHLIFNVAGETGVGLWAAEYCMNEVLNYHMFLPFVPDKTSENWLDEQKALLNACYNPANAITICNDENEDFVDASLKQIVDGSNFTICFWVGKKQGKTYDIIQYALANNKIVLNGLDGLRLVTNEDLYRKRSC